MAEPSIKGIAILQLVEDVCRLRDEGSVSTDELEARLTPAGLAMLDQKMRPTGWYPIDGYQSLARLLCDTLGSGSADYLRARGGASAERLLAAGIYQQIDYVANRYRPADQEELQSGLKLMITLQGSLLNFGSWSVTVDPEHEGRVQIEIGDAACFPEELCHATAGFVTRLGQKAGSSGLEWFHERPEPDRVVLRMDRTPALTGDAD